MGEDIDMTKNDQQNEEIIEGSKTEKPTKSESRYYTVPEELLYIPLSDDERLILFKYFGYDNWLKIPEDDRKKLAIAILKLIHLHDWTYAEVARLIKWNYKKLKKFIDHTISDDVMKVIVDEARKIKASKILPFSSPATEVKAVSTIDKTVHKQFSKVVEGLVTDVFSYWNTILRFKPLAEKMGYESISEFVADAVNFYVNHKDEYIMLRSQVKVLKQMLKEALFNCMIGTEAKAVENIIKLYEGMLVAGVENMEEIKQIEDMLKRGETEKLIEISKKLIEFEKERKMIEAVNEFGKLEKENVICFKKQMVIGPLEGSFKRDKPDRFTGRIIVSSDYVKKYWHLLRDYEGKYLKFYIIFERETQDEAKSTPSSSKM